jgi:hypothetical protein
MHRLTIESPGRRWRVILYSEGGFHVEQYVRGPGWVLADNIPDDEVTPLLLSARRSLALALEKWAVVCSPETEAAHAATAT